MKILLFSLSLLLIGGYGFNLDTSEAYISYAVNSKQTNLKLYWKDNNGKPYKSFDKLKNELEQDGKELLFAMNGGMFTTSFGPLGLYVEDGEEMNPINTKQKGYGNFYLQPNGVFQIDSSGKASIVNSSDYKNNGTIKYATQSGPLLLVDGKPHPEFTKGSKNVNIRNGVGVMENGDLLFAMSKDKVNFFEFAQFFLQNGCTSALYLDGFVSRTYLPSANWIQTGGQFGVIIAESRSVLD